ncbi:guanine-1-methyltransferase-domain-containing protein [Xylariaceae sp. FL0662B]|nr:guanine-1-methyltransferase-domain-containing protein [Xylariaceae sp. FL0662B]
MESAGVDDKLETTDALNSETLPKQDAEEIQNIRSSAAITEVDEERNLKRPAEEGNIDNDGGSQDAESGESKTEIPKLSKNQQRKLKRRKIWEEKKHEKRAIRKDKRHEKSERKRLEREAEIAAAAAEGREPVVNDSPKRQRKSGTKVPVTVIIDCQFEKYMMEKELVSLASQVTRCYSDNRNAEFPVHMFISSFGGEMKERYETVLKNQYKSWKNVHFTKGDFVEAAIEAKDLMKGPQGGELIDVLAQSSKGDCISLPKPQPDAKKKKKITPVPEPESEDVDKSIVYLTADSPYTLDRLEPNTCYVIGGIIDKNREKGLCYKIAREKIVRTAKLPIGEFMLLQSRHILATNHVMEIMLRWLETGNWGTAFMKVIPTRKGGVLKEDENTPEAGQEELENASPPVKSEDEKFAAEGDEVPVASSTAEEPNAQESSDAVQVKGENSEEGLQKNSLGEQRWSAPPEEAKASCTDAIS